MYYAHKHYSTVGDAQTSNVHIIGNIEESMHYICCLR